MRELSYNEAAVEAVAEEMRRDPKIFYMSTDALPPLLKEFGPQRIRATPITEAALTGMAIGAAGSGFRPIVDWRRPRRRAALAVARVPALTARGVAASTVSAVLRRKRLGDRQGAAAGVNRQP